MSGARVVPERPPRSMRARRCYSRVRVYGGALVRCALHRGHEGEHFAALRSQRLGAGLRWWRV